MLVAIAIESGLAVIGLSSLQESTLGTMIYWALQYQALLAGRWWWILTPVIAIMTLFITLFLLASGQAERASARRGRDVTRDPRPRRLGVHYLTPAGPVKASTTSR